VREHERWEVLARRLAKLASEAYPREWMLRLKLIALFPFFSRWVEASPACCGVCPTCIGAAATGMLLPVVFGEREKVGD